MSFYGDLSFFVILSIILLPAVILGAFEKSLKKYRLISSLLILILIVSTNLIELFYMILFIIWSSLVVFIYLRQRHKNKKFADCVVAIIASLLPLLAFKISGLFGNSIFSFIGISYITFKIIQLILETYDGIIKKLKISEYLEFVLFFPTFSSGPIDRSRRFEKDNDCIWSRQEYLGLLGEGLWKITFGIVYKFILSAIAYNIMTEYFFEKTLLSLIGYAYSYGIYMFFDFAGYSLMAIGTSYILGIKTPDNFKAPFISIDISEFWNRWHISLSHWFRDFIFSRLIMLNIRHKWIKNRLLAACLGLMVNMTIMGIWHGLASYYIIYGIYHGALLSLNEVYQKKSKIYKRFKNYFLYKCISWLLTINAVMFGFLIFSGHIDMLHIAKSFLINTII